MTLLFICLLLAAAGLGGWLLKIVFLEDPDLDPPPVPPSSQVTRRKLMQIPSTQPVRRASISYSTPMDVEVLEDEILPPPRDIQGINGE